VYNGCGGAGDWVKASEHGRHLRKSSYRSLTVPRTWTTFGDRSFTVAGPRLWNSLPATLRSTATDSLGDIWKHIYLGPSWRSTNTKSKHRNKMAKNTTRMWGNAQRDGRPAEYHPLWNATVWLTPTTRWNLQGCPKQPNRSQPLGSRSSPYYEDMWRRYCCLTSFFPIVDTDTCLSCEDSADKVVRWCPDGDFCIIFAFCISSEPHAAHYRPAC